MELELRRVLVSLVAVVLVELFLGETLPGIVVVAVFALVSL